MSRRTRSHRKAKSRPQRKRLLFESLEQRLVLSGQSLASAFAGYEDQIGGMGESRTVRFTIAEGAIAAEPAYVNLTVNQQLSTASALAGDYDFDGSVDGRDFLAWQRNFGATGVNPADGNGNGVVDAADYVVWRDNFGAAAPIRSSLSPQVVMLRDSQGVAISPTQSGFSPTGSFALFALAAGEYSAEISAGAGGAFELRASLVGDLDGNHVVEASDLASIRTLLETSEFEASADVNLDGRITSLDYSYARRNLNREVGYTPLNSATLGESSSYVRRLSQMIDVSAAEGARTLTIDIDATFDASTSGSTEDDLFQVYLVDPTTGDSLLSAGQTGAALFTLSVSGSEYTPGLVSFDGQRITVDLTSISGIDEAELVLQLLSGDQANGSSVRIVEIQNSVDAEGAARPLLSQSTNVVEPGPALDLNALHLTEDLTALLSHISFDLAEGIYRALLHVRNDGAAAGRDIAVVFGNLPPGVTAISPTGFDSLGKPYWSLKNAIPSGGLKQGGKSGVIEIAFKNSLLLRTVFAPTVLVGAANRAPTLAEFPTLIASPGEKFSLAFPSLDEDGDTVSYTLSAPGGIPTSQFFTSGRLEIFPRPDELGTYQFAITASDGTLSVTRHLTLEVIPDVVATTRISGIVLSTNGLPLDNVPVEIAGFTALTAADGTFTIELPTMKTPTEAFNIKVPTGDIFLDPLSTGLVEIPLRRSRFNVTSGDSPLNPRQHLSLVTSFIDAGIVYGSDAARAAALRTFSNGKLKTSEGNLLPFNNAATFPEGLLENDNESRVDPASLFVSGDVRTNENVALIALHTLLVREHNRLADEIKAADASLSDEAIYQQARRLVGAIIQHITYNEYLPILLGQNTLTPYAGYDPMVDPSESALFAAAAFRLGHTQLSPEIARLDASGQSLPGGPLALRNAFFTPVPIQADGIEPFLRGLAATPMQEMDAKIIDDVRNFLFGPPGAGGMDLASLNIQRGRDVGLASYTQARLDFGLPAITSFSQITSDAAVQTALQGVYGTVDKIDVWVGGLVEDRSAGSLVGPLFQAILADQFERTRDGDRFWFENGQFTDSELATIRGTTLEQLIERNAPGVDLSAHPFTTGVQPSGPAAAGSAAATMATEFRTVDGSDNNLANPTLGATGSNVLRNFTNGYGDGISTPGGADRPGAREISNAVNAQSVSMPSATGVTSLLTFWGQLLDHDLGLTPGGVSDTLKIQGNLRPVSADGAAYPFVAEKMSLMLDHVVYPGVNNVIVRPVYLPAIDVANSVTVVPSQDTLITTAAIPGASVMVEEGNLLNRQGVIFAAELSITEVPRDLTPAALPPGVFPDLVVTIQPADMVFTTPAPMTLPNRAGYAPGTMMDLWSINPVTGLFDDVGDGRVSSDGSVIETISGGIRNSSWHFFSPPPPAPNNPGDDGRNQNNTCNECLCTQPLSSDVELHSGAVIESHDLVPYQSLGVSRGVTLSYDSLRADPRPIIHFSYSNVTADSNLRLMASLQVGLKGPGASPGGADLSFVGPVSYGPNNYWTIPADAAQSRIDAALQADLRSKATGLYRYEINSGLVRYNSQTGEFFGGTLPRGMVGETIVVNSINSNFGSGWGIAGLLEIVENEDNSILLVDGDGGEMKFTLQSELGGERRYKSPPGDFSEFVRLADGTYRRTMTDRMVYRFDATGRLTSMTDRNGNETRYEYGAAGLERIIDPVGLATIFGYAGAKVTSISDPAGRVTQLSYDGAGNLTRITDPDGTSRTFEYDDGHHLTAETDQNNNREQTLYDFAGRATGAIKKDGAPLTVSPVQTQGLYAPDLTLSPIAPPAARELGPVEASYSDSNGNVIRTLLDQAGQSIFGRDGGGGRPQVIRDFSNEITSIVDGRGFHTSFAYDRLGNLIETNKVLTILDERAGNLSFSQRRLEVSDEVHSLTAADFDHDGQVDLAIGGFMDVSVARGDGVGGFAVPSFITPFEDDYAYASAVVAADLNGDGNLDLVSGLGDASNIFGSLPGSLVVSLGDGAGGFQPWRYFPGQELFHEGMVAADFNNDNLLDVISLSGGLGGTSLRLYLGNSSSIFGSPQVLTQVIEPADLATADLNGDGNFDLIVENQGNDRFVYVYLGDGGGAFGPAQTIDVGVGSGVVAWDVNDDQMVDLIVPNFLDDTVTVVLGDGLGGFAPKRSFFAGDGPVDVAVADFDGDGVLDLATANPNSGAVTILVGDGEGSFEARRVISLGFQPDMIVAADFVAGGLTDIAVAERYANSVVTLLNGTVASTITATQTFSYDPTYSQLTSYTDERGHQTLYTIDPASGNRLSTREVVGQVDGMGNTETNDLVSAYTYNARGQVFTMTDPLGRIMEFGYDTVARLTQVTYAKGTADEAIERYEYNQATVAGRAGLVTAFIDGEGRRTEYEYDVMNRLMRTISPDPDAAGPLASPVTQFDYDNRGYLTSAIDANGNETTYQYDPLDRVIRTTGSDPDGGGPLPAPVTQFAYDMAGNLAAVLDPLGHETRHRYDARNRRIETIDPDGGLTKFRYDADNNLTSLTDPVGNRTRFTFDERSRIVREVDPLGATITYTYDGTDNLVRKTDRNGRVTTYAYDDLDRLTSEIWVGANHTINYAYDKASNLLSVSDPLSALAFSYDARNRVQTVDNNGTPGAPRVILTYAYDDVGNVLSVVDTINGTAGANTGYQYDALDRLTRLTQMGVGLADKRVDLAYNPLGQYESVRRYADLAGTQLVVGTSYTYDSLNRLDRMSHVNGASQTVAFYDLDYDTASRITRITDVDGAVDYAYDNRDQLVGANYDAAREAGGYVDENYQYDANGNRLQSHLHGTGYVTGPGNRLLSDGTYNYEYDAEGNTIKRTRISGTEADGSTIREFTWDHRNRLIAVTDKLPGGTPTQVVEFTYDALDRRISKAVDTTPLDAVDAAILHFVYDREDVILDFADPDGSGAAPTGLDQRYLHGDAIDEVFAQDNATGAVHWHLTDHLGTVRDLADSGGAVASHIRYDSYGNIESQSGTAATRYAFTGREWDEETSLAYYRARYFDTAVGRFLNEDSLGFDAGTSNFYEYVFNSPTHYTDPSGNIAPALALLWGLYELGQGLYDLYDTYDTLTDPCASTTDKLLSLGGTLSGTVLPGGGYGSAAKGVRQASKRGREAVDAVLDSTGKVHGILPDVNDLARYDLDELVKLQDELRQSVQKRIEKTVQMGGDYGHNKRLAVEQQLIRSIEKHLKDQ